MPLKDKTIAFIGGGHITEIIVSNLFRNWADATTHFIVSDPDAKRLAVLNQKYGVRKAENNADAFDQGDIIFINVLPEIVPVVLDDIKHSPRLPQKILISLAAGVPMATYEALSDALPVIRALPNPPSRIGMGISALAFNDRVTEKQRKEILLLFSSLGKCIILAEERINAVTALSSPAPIYLFFQAMIDAGVKNGLDRDTSTQVVFETIIGSMMVWKKRQIAPVELMKEACTPGGISLESLLYLEKHGFQAAIADAIDRAALKAERIGK